MTIKRNILLFLLICFSLTPVQPIIAQEEKPQDEATLKALFIYTFSKHIEWPAGVSTDKFTITVFGNYQLAGKLMTMLKDQNLNGKKIIITEADEIADIPVSNILYVSNKKSEYLKQIQEKFKNSPTLIITEESKLPQGSHINLQTRQNKMTFDLNETFLKSCGMKASRQLHDLANKVE
ncbi:MAG: YfiR family protein [Bacteroidia bacterium]